MSAGGEHEFGQEHADEAPEQHGYRTPYHWGMGPFYQYVVEQGVRRIVPVVEGRSVLEMGCGDGFVTSLLAARADRVYGFDVNERAIRFAEMIVEVPNVGFGVGRAGEIVKMAKHVEGEVDVVASFEVIEHMSADELRAFLAGALELLAPRGGALVLTTPNGASRVANRNPHHAHEFTPRELGDLLRVAGFTQVRVSGLYLQPPWPRLEHFATTVPFRAIFRRLARAGAGHPERCRTLVCVARAGG